MIGRIYGEDAREEAAWAIEYDRPGLPTKQALGVMSV